MKHRVVIVWVSLLMMAACATEPPPSPTPVDTPTPNEVVVTPDATRMSRDLPPTWTPTDTPTITPTPSITPSLTPTLTPTPIDFEQLCEAFTATTAIEDGDTYDEADTIRLSYGIDPAYDYAFVGVVLEHDELDDAIADIVPAGNSYTSSFVIADFPFAGRWDYRMGVFLINGEDILCVQSGYFFVAEKSPPTVSPNLIPTAMPFPSITPQPTARPTQPVCYDTCLEPS